ncbi:aldehyde dehydrogenase [Alkalihalobacillus pseudalcaliphilus]|uniref:aldehyde dehydrogenase n=1 Tax=Alkalihalobacillus pseudalcaliphilus TaxID=79884 RepID=UPI00064E120D|nr:aldehyde dehydrogenase [Alkalihalobacillus pseudalcaliphilus]KMK75009.1 aldehyde dehydrogenase [Alkalihalobacillus pseudalcaliphilus]
MFADLQLKQKEYFYRGETKDLEFRLKQLDKLYEVLKANEDLFFDALAKDLNKSKDEAYVTEMMLLYQEINHTKKHLEEWMKPEKVKTAISHTGSQGYIQHEPYGVSLIIAPWNYPVQLAFAPLIGAVSAGNCAVVKPSELTPNVSRAITNVINNHFPKEYIHAVEGAVEESQALLDLPFDYIFFTGSVAVGKKVMEAASKRLTPLTLELGGKSPVIVDKEAKIDVAAKRIAFGKFLNAGQTCVAPDYLLVHQEVKHEFLAALNKEIQRFKKDKINKGKYVRIVSERHFERLVSFLDEGETLIGGGYSEAALRINPTVLQNVALDSPLMEEEIFGPILPIFTYEKIEEVYAMVRERPNPLALYVFTENKDLADQVLENLSFGGGCVNDTVMHLATPHLPFGGVGESGMGAYHGFESFAAFSHRKSILKQTTKFDLAVRYKQNKFTTSVLRKLVE